MTADCRPSLDSCSLASAWIFAWWYWPRMLAASDCCCSSSLFSRTFRLVRSASAARSCSSASTSSCCTRLVAQLEDDGVGLEDVGARQRDDALHRGVGGAVIQRMSSGTSVPGPRTCRSIWPRLTVSRQVVPRSTVGAAGFSCASPTVTSATTMMAATPKTTRRIFFFLMTMRDAQYPCVKYDDSQCRYVAAVYGPSISSSVPHRTHRL